MRIPGASLIILGVLSGTSLDLCAEEESLALEVMLEQYDKECAEARKPLEELGEKYLAAMRALEGKLQKAGDLEGMLVLKKEMRRFEKEKSPPSAQSVLAPLVQLQGIYREQRRRVYEGIDKALAAIHASYKKKLEDEVRSLTVAREFDEAVKVRKAMAELGGFAIDRERWGADRVLHLRFEEAPEGVIPDGSGLGNHGRLKGDAALRPSGGIRGSYLSLDGDGDFAECAHSDALSLGTDGSIALWIRPRELHDLRGLVCKYTPRNAFTLRTSKRPGGTRVIFGDYNNTNFSRSFLVPDEWVHVTVTLADHVVRFYVDGVLDSEAFRQKRVPLAQNTNPVRIGSDYTGRYFVGDIDEVRIYRRALNATEVARIHRAESRPRQ